MQYIAYLLIGGSSDSRNLNWREEIPLLQQVPIKEESGFFEGGVMGIFSQKPE